VGWVNTKQAKHKTDVIHAQQAICAILQLILEHSLRAPLDIIAHQDHTHQTSRHARQEHITRLPWAEIYLLVYLAPQDISAHLLQCPLLMIALLAAIAQSQQVLPQLVAQLTVIAHSNLLSIFHAHQVHIQMVELQKAFLAIACPALLIIIAVGVQLANFAIKDITA
jgi:hypothetical protein